MTRQRTLLTLTAAALLASCSSARDADVCADDEAVTVSISMPVANPSLDTEPPGIASPALAAVTAQVEVLAGQPWRGSRSASGHARLRCWYDQEDDVIGRIVSASIDTGLRSTAEWLSVADASRHDAIKAAVLTTLLGYDAGALPRWMALMSADGRGLHVSALKTLAFRDDPAVMAAVTEAIDASGYPGDGLMGAPFEHDLRGWAAAQRRHYWSVVWPTYWLLGIGAPDDTSVVDRIREVHTVGEELQATERYIETLSWLEFHRATDNEEAP